MSQVSTKQQRIAQLAKECPRMVFTTLAHHIDVEWLREAYARVRKDGAAGVDKQTWKEYGQDLERNLVSLLNRFKSGSYQAPPVRRVHIPKGEGTATRPIGIPTIEDKILQRAVVMLLEPIYEEMFRSWSYGFRPGRSAHQALEYLWQQANATQVSVILDVDIKAFFDTIPHEKLREVVSQRVRDGVVIRVIGKWLKAGVMEAGEISYAEEGTPQGGVISPLLANLYLHEVLDEWFAETVKPRLKGRAFMVRYADDFVMGFEHEQDAQRVYEVLPKRLARYGLKHHPEKTRLVEFVRPKEDGKESEKATRESESEEENGQGGSPETFDFLGFTHYWGKSRKGWYLLKRKTAKKRLNRAIKRISEWCQENRHLNLREQWEKLTRKLKGHYAYYGITGNGLCLTQFSEAVKKEWHKWLNRRDRNGHVSWERFSAMLRGVFRLPPPRIVHSIYAAKQ